jgi:hypothetical protein
MCYSNTKYLRNSVVHFVDLNFVNMVTYFTARYIDNFKFSEQYSKFLFP